jgi:hypothetical protein
VKPIFATALCIVLFMLVSSACDSKKNPIASGREAVKEVVTQPFNA